MDKSQRPYSLRDNIIFIMRFVMIHTYFMSLISDFSIILWALCNGFYFIFIFLLKLGFVLSSRGSHLFSPHSSRQYNREYSKVSFLNHV